MSLFNFKYHTERAEDILNGKDPVVYAGAITMRGLALPLLSSSSNNNNNTVGGYLSIRPERTIESQFHQQEAVKEAKKDFKTVYSAKNDDEEEEDYEDALIGEALSRGFSIRRQRHQDDVKNTKEEDKNNNKPKAKRSKTVDAIPQQKIEIPGTLSHHILLTPQEMQKLQSSISNYHQTTSRSDSKSLYEKLYERLSSQRVQFVNDMIQRRKQEREANTNPAVDGEEETSGKK